MIGNVKGSFVRIVFQIF